MGRTATPETRAKLAAAKTGTKASEETRKILREAWVRRRLKADRRGAAMSEGFFAVHHG
jgi:hypothetical protein